MEPQMYLMDFTRSGNGREIEKLDLSNFIRFYQATKEVIAQECIDAGVPANFRLLCKPEEIMTDEEIKQRMIVLDALNKVYLKNHCHALSEELMREFKINNDKKLNRQSKIIKFMVVMYILLISYLLVR